MTFSFTHMAAAVPAAWPMTMQQAMTRMVPNAWNSAETFRPAARRLMTLVATRLL